MTNLNSTHKITAAATFGAVALFSMLSFGSNAEASSVLNCKGASATKIASCCEKVVEENGRRPLWMLQARMNCHDVKEIVRCKGYLCDIQTLLIDHEGGGDGEDGGGDQGGGPNSPR